jgi:hypothetical protein
MATSLRRSEQLGAIKQIMGALAPVPGDELGGSVSYLDPLTKRAGTSRTRSPSRGFRACGLLPAEARNGAGASCQLMQRSLPGEANLPHRYNQPDAAQPLAADGCREAGRFRHRPRRFSETLLSGRRARRGSLSGRRGRWMRRLSVID